MIYVLGGGSSLNFKVVGGTSAPASPKENTIWVNTNTAITDWVFSATQPAGAAGRVWFCTGTTSTAPFNALKKNNLTVYPISAKQYVGGAWVEGTAKTYQDGAWVAWTVYLYNKGTFNTIGGLTPYAYGPEVSASARVKPTQTKGTNSIKLEIAKSGSNAAGSCFGDNKVDLTPYSKLNIHVSAASSDGSAEKTCTVRIGVSSTREDNFTFAAVKAICSNGETITSAKTISCDISSLNGNYYVLIAFYGSANQEITFDQIWLE